MPDTGSHAGRSIAVVGVLGFVGLLTGLVVATLAFELVVTMVPSLRDSLPAQNAILTVGQGIGIVAVVGFYLLTNELPWSYLRIDYPDWRDLVIAGITVVGLFTLLAVTLEVLALFDVTTTEHGIADSARDDPRVLLPLIPLSVLVTGPAEELLYRGVIQTRLTEAIDAVPAIFVASTIFAVVHVPAYMAGSGLGIELVGTIATLLLLGVVLGAAYEFTGNLAVPIVAHGLYNAVTYGSSYVSLV